MRAFLIGAALLVVLAVTRTEAFDPATISQVQLLGTLEAESRAHTDVASIARAQGGTKPVRTFGQTVLDGHARLGAALQIYAKSNRIPLADTQAAYERLMDEASAPDAGSWRLERRQQLERTRTLSGAEFDREFLSKIAEGSQRQIAFLQGYLTAHAGEQHPDEALKELLDDWVSTLRGLQHEAEQLQRQLPAT